MPRAEAVLREKVIDEDGNITELVIWKVSLSERNPTGVRFRLAFVRRGEERPAVLYDDHPPKGPHRHVEGTQEPYHFVDVDRLIEDFTADVRRVLGDARWPRR